MGLQKKECMDFRTVWKDSVQIEPHEWTEHGPLRTAELGTREAVDLCIVSFVEFGYDGSERRWRWKWRTGREARGGDRDLGRGDEEEERRGEKRQSAVRLSTVYRVRGIRDIFR